MYKKKVLAFVLSLFVYGWVIADTVKLNPNHPDQYVVVTGDTLWDISGRFLENPWQWPEIWHINTQIENPHLIYPGDVISLVYVDGKPRLSVKRGSKTVKLSPQGRVTTLDKAINTIPFDAIAPFLFEPIIVSEKELESAPYVVQHKGKHIIASSTDSIYVRGIKDNSIRDYTIVHPGNIYIDPVTKENLGREARFSAIGKLYRTGDPSTVEVLRNTREILIGDRLIPTSDDSYDTNFYPSAPDTQINAKILAVLDGMSEIGSLQVVVLNKGQREGLKPGNVMDVFQTGETIFDEVTADRKDKVTLPDEKAGTLMVFRTFEKVSYALIMVATRNMHINDDVRNP